MSLNSTLPVLISTLLITLGWMLVLLPVGPVEEVRSPGDLQRLFDPSRTAFNYGFLGTYFFALNMVFRRYVRADLTPKAYSHITLRLLVVVHALRESRT